MAWLVYEGTVLASLEHADTVHTRIRGLLGRDSFDGALLLPKTKSVHTLGMRFPIDVAFCDEDLVVLRILTLPPHRISRPEIRAHSVIEVEAGRFRHWGVHEGDQLEIRGELDDDLPDD